MSSDLKRPQNWFCRRTRREALWQLGGGFAGVALAGLLDGDGFFAQGADAVGVPAFRPQLPAKAKSVIFLFMYGGPSQVDTFEYKPRLFELDGQTIPVKTFGRGGKKNEGRVIGPKWAFKRYGNCGKYVSDLFPNLATCVDDIAFIHSMTADSPIHGSRDASDEHRQDPQRQPVSGFVGELRPGERESQPAGLCGHA